MYALMWIGYLSGWTWLVAMDSAALDVAYRYGSMHPGWVTGWDVFCTVLGPNAFRLAGLVVVVVALWRRNWRLAGFVLIAAGLSGPLVELAKYVGRPPAAPNRIRVRLVVVVSLRSRARCDGRRARAA